MKLAIFSDIHGNISFFRSCLTKMAEYQIDKYFFLGDAVGYMPYATEVLELLDSINADCLMGNHDARICGFLEYSIESDDLFQNKRAALSLPEHLKTRMKSLLPYKFLSLDGMNILFAHGSPWNPLMGYVYPDSAESFYDNSELDFIFLGHSHHPFIQKNAHTTVVNVGSAGLPRDIGNMPSFIVLDTLTKEPKIVRLELEIQEILEDLKIKNVHEDVLSCLNRRSQ